MQEVEEHLYPSTKQEEVPFQTICPIPLFLLLEGAGVRQAVRLLHVLQTAKQLAEAQTPSLEQAALVTTETLLPRQWQLVEAAEVVAVLAVD
jgi:hypothetical protein